MPETWTCVVCQATLLRSEIHWWDETKEEYPHCKPKDSKCCQTVVDTVMAMRNLKELLNA